MPLTPKIRSCLITCFIHTAQYSTKLSTDDFCMNFKDICFSIINRKIFLGKIEIDLSFYNLFFGLNLCLCESGQQPEPGKPITGQRLELHRCNWTSAFIILALTFIDYRELSLISCILKAFSHCFFF